MAAAPDAGVAPLAVAAHARGAYAWVDALPSEVRPTASAQRATLLAQADALASAVALQADLTGANPLAGWVPPPPPARRAPPVAGAPPPPAPSPPPSTSSDYDTDYDSDAAAAAADAAAAAAEAARARAELPAGGRYALDPDVRDAITGLYGVRDNVEKDVATALAYALGTTEVALRHCFAKLRDSARTLTKRAAASSTPAPSAAALAAAAAARTTALAAVAPLLDADGGVASVEAAPAFVAAVRDVRSHTVRASVLGAMCATGDARVRCALRDAGAVDVARSWLTAAVAAGDGTEAALALRALAALPGGASGSTAAAAGRLTAAALTGDAALRQWGSRAAGGGGGAVDGADGGTPPPAKRTRASTGALPLPRSAWETGADSSDGDDRGGAGRGVAPGGRRFGTPPPDLDKAARALTRVAARVEEREERAMREAVEAAAAAPVAPASGGDRAARAARRSGDGGDEEEGDQDEDAMDEEEEEEEEEEEGAGEEAE